MCVIGFPSCGPLVMDVGDVDMPDVDVDVDMEVDVDGGGWIGEKDHLTSNSGHFVTLTSSFIQSSSDGYCMMD